MPIAVRQGSIAPAQVDLVSGESEALGKILGISLGRLSPSFSLQSLLSIHHAAANE